MQRERAKRIGVAAVAVTIAMAASACGGSDSVSQPPETTVVATTGTTGSSTSETTAGGGSAVEPTTMDEWEALWAKERAAVVKNITDNEWGLSADGSTVRGPAGFTIDLSTCAAGWKNDEGLTDTQIKIGFPTALSGLAADTGLVSKSADVLYKYYADKGFFKDSEGKTRKIDYVVRDVGVRRGEDHPARR